MRWAHSYSALLCIIGLAVVQSQNEVQTEDKVQEIVGSLQKPDIVPPAVNGSNSDQSSENHNNQTAPGSTLPPPTRSVKNNIKSSEGEKEVTPSDTHLEPLSVKVLHGESNALSVSDMSDLKPRKIRPLLNRSNIISSVDFHWRKSLIFYVAGNKIYRARIVGIHSLSEIQVVANATSTARLAVDWVHDLLFWMSDKYQTVEVADLDGGNRRLIIDNIKPFKYPNNIAVDPHENALFFVSNYSVFKSSLNGSRVERLNIDFNKRGQRGRGVRCLALDRLHHRLYLTGENHPDQVTNISSIYVTSTNYDGSKMVELEAVGQVRNWTDIFGIDVFRDTLYLAHYDSNFTTGHPDTLWTFDLITNNTELRFSPSLIKSGMWSIRVYHPDVQRLSENQIPRGPVQI